MGRYLAYLTVSNEDRGEARAELAAQEATCRSHAERNESSLFALFIDEGVGERCGLEKRPALLEAIGHLDRGDTLLVPARYTSGGDPIEDAFIESAVVRKDALIIPMAGDETEKKMPPKGLKRRILDTCVEYERLAAGMKTEKAFRAKQDRGELIERRKRLWRNSWNSLLETVERLD
ncbi:MAG: recombinase family protein [Syntrophobacteraceae bacterium]